MGFDADIKVRVSVEEKQALADIAAQRRGNVRPSVIVREAIQEYLERNRKSARAAIDKLGDSAEDHNKLKAAAKTKQAARKKAA